jgi:uncharacterized membrane protein YbhN (UPF0104 family)
VRFIAGVLVGLVALWFAGRGLDWHLVSQALAAVRWGWVVASVIGVIAVAMAKTERWRTLYWMVERRPPFVVLFGGLMAAQAVNLVFPVRLGELVRIGWMKGADQPAAATLSTIVIEKAIDFLAAGLMVLSLVSLALAPNWLLSQARGMVLVSLMLLAGLVLIWQMRVRLGRWMVYGLRWGNRLPEPCQACLVRGADTLRAALDAMADWRSLSAVLGWTMIIWLLSLLTILALLAAFELRLPLVAAMLIMLVVGSSNTVPSPPALVGVMQLMAGLVLGGYGVARPVAVGFGTILNLVAVAPILVLGAWALGSNFPLLVTWLHRVWRGELRTEG